MVLCRLHVFAAGLIRVSYTSSIWSRCQARIKRVFRFFAVALIGFLWLTTVWNAFNILCARLLFWRSLAASGLVLVSFRSSRKHFGSPERNSNMSREPERFVFADWPKELVQKNFTHLVGKCQPEALRTPLYEAALLTEREMKQVRKMLDTGKLDDEVNQWLFLEVFPRRASGAFDKLIEVLWETEGHRSVLQGMDVSNVSEDLKKRWAQLLQLSSGWTGAQVDGASTSSCRQVQETGRAVSTEARRETTDPHHEDIYEPK